MIPDGFESDVNEDLRAELKQRVPVELARRRRRRFEGRSEIELVAWLENKERVDLQTKQLLRRVRDKALTELDAQFTAALDQGEVLELDPGRTIFARCCSRLQRRSLLRRANPEPCHQPMAADRRERDARYNASAKGRARHARYNTSDNGRARWLAYYNRRETDPAPVNEVTDQHGNVHAMTAGDYFRFSERVRKAKYGRRKRIEEGDAKITQAELRVEARR